MSRSGCASRTTGYLHKKHLHEDVVPKIVDDPGLDYDKLPGPKSCV
jgi:hypothetical protein